MYSLVKVGRSLRARAVSPNLVRHHAAHWTAASEPCFGVVFELNRAFSCSIFVRLTFSSPHHLGERRVKKSLKLLVMIHHDFLSVWYCFYEWFTRPLRVALLLCAVVTLMATEATVFSTIMFKVSSVTANSLRMNVPCRTVVKGSS